jgi:glycerophosphoryl diester phosphodiesterase
MSQAPLVIAHRGASAHAIDNSIDAFAKAIDAGADMIEFDVRRTADDQLIAFHDAAVGRVPVGRLTRAEIGERTGYVPPLVDEVLEVTAGRIGLDVELKEDGYVERVLASVVARHGAAEDVVITSFLDEVVRQVKSNGHDLRAGLLLGRTHVAALFPVTRAKRSRADFVALHHLLVARGLLRRADAAGYASLVWTVNDDRGLRSLLHDERVLGVVTDVPGRAVALRDGDGSSRGTIEDQS